LRNKFLGVDLGTTYSAMAYIDETGNTVVTRNSLGQNTTPSVVYFESEHNVVVGEMAKEAAGLQPESVVAFVKREMGDREYRLSFFGVEYTPASISALILTALAQDAEIETGGKVADVVISVPAYFGTLERDATRQAGEIAGLNVVGIVPEPVAAALHYGFAGNVEDEVLFVYDLGGGTFDISLIRLNNGTAEVITVGGDHRLGGIDWDSRILDYFVDQVIAQCGDDSLLDDEAMLQELRTLAEKTKNDLSKVEKKTVLVRYAGHAAKITLTREEFERMTADLLDETVRITKRTMSDAESVRPGICGQISEVLLVGGTTRMPAVREALSREFGWNPKLSDPDLAVAKGAALYASQLSVQDFSSIIEAPPHPSQKVTGTGATPTHTTDPANQADMQGIAARTGLDEEAVSELAKRTVVNVLPKAIGIKLINTDIPGWEHDPESASYVEHLIDAQTPLPSIRNPIVASTVVPRQEEIEIEIWEQAGALPARNVSANHLVASGRITGLSRFSLAPGSPINIQLSVDGEGTVRIQATEPTSGQQVEIAVRISILSIDEVAEAKAAHLGLRVTT
jgi:molecular chaperone DnaK